MEKTHSKNLSPTQMPHVVLMLGPHVRGSEAAVKKVIINERPRMLLLESLGNKRGHVKILKDLHEDAPRFVHHPADGYAVPSRVYLLAKEHEIPFELAEPPYDEATFKRILSKQAEYQAKLGGSIKLVTSGGKLEEALRLTGDSIQSMKEAHAERDSNLADNIYKQAKAHGVVAAFLGHAHMPVVRKLAEKGAKVTVYYSGGTFPASNALPQRSNLPEPSRSQLIKELFSMTMADYLCNRYNLDPVNLMHGLQGGTVFNQLTKIPVPAIEAMFKASEGKTPVGCRNDLLTLLSAHNVKMPSQSEMEGIVHSASYPEFRKVKVFEPLQP